MKLRAIALAAAAASAAAACAPAMTPEEMSALAADATIKVLDSDFASADVSVSNLNKTPASSSWTASTPQGVYDCTGNEQFALAVCLPADTNVASN